jgi:hypothetical protein
MFMNPVTDVLGLPSGVVLFGLGFIGLLVAFVWIRRIVRGPEDDDDHWRYRR